MACARGAGFEFGRETSAAKAALENIAAKHRREIINRVKQRRPGVQTRILVAGDVINQLRRRVH